MKTVRIELSTVILAGLFVFVLGMFAGVSIRFEQSARTVESYLESLGRTAEEFR